METNKKKILAIEMFKKVANKIGATINIEPTWGHVGQIIFKDGKKAYFRQNSLNINPVGSCNIAKDKDYSNFFMEKMGYPIVPNSRTFFSDKFAKSLEREDRKIDQAYQYAEEIGLPVIVKPNKGSQGFGVALVNDKKEFYDAMKIIFEKYKVAIVQKPVKGKDYRIVVLDNKVVSAYERIPLNIIGNGKLTIRELLEIKIDEIITTGRKIEIKIENPKIQTKLKNLNLTISYIPKKGEQIHLLDNANLSTGGDSIDMTSKIHKDFKNIAINLTRDMGLRFCGVDLMIEKDITKKPEKYWVLEINSFPGLSHFSKMGTKQEKIVEKIYLEILKKIEK